MKKVIFIGGTTAAGKTTLALKLKEYYPSAILFRRVKGFYDLADERNIPKERMFNEISSDDVDNYFISICKQNDLVISDIHYSVEIADENNPNKTIYVPTISNSLVNKLLSNDIIIVPMFLECSPYKCFEREIERYKSGKRGLKHSSVDKVKLENLYEKKEFLKIASQCQNAFIFNSEMMSSEEITKDIQDKFNNQDFLPLKNRRL